MKGDSVVSNLDDVVISNESMDRKIKFLEAEKMKREAYIKDLQESLSINKESMSALASALNQESIAKLNQQNQLLLAQIKRQYDENLSTQALLLIEQQLRIEQKKIYQERLVEYENNMTELRKYLQDKEDSFSAIVVRLKKYEDLNEVSLSTKLDRFQKQFKADPMPKIIEELTEERDRYRGIWKEFELQMEDLSFLKECLQDKRAYEEMRNVYQATLQEGSNQLTDKFISFYEKNKTLRNNHDSSQNASSMNDSPNPNRELIKLLKKEKVNNEILVGALHQAIEKNQEVIGENNILVQANLNYQLKLQSIEAKAYLLQQELARFQRNLQKKTFGKFKCDLDVPKKERPQLEMHGDQPEMCLHSLKIDMEKLSSFIISCVPRGKLFRSSSCPRVQTVEEEEMQEVSMGDIGGPAEQEDLEIEQI